MSKPRYVTGSCKNELSEFNTMLQRAKLKTKKGVGCPCSVNDHIKVWMSNNLMFCICLTHRKGTLFYRNADLFSGTTVKAALKFCRLHDRIDDAIAKGKLKWSTLINPVSMRYFFDYLEQVNFVKYKKPTTRTPLGFEFYCKALRGQIPPAKEFDTLADKPVTNDKIIYSVDPTFIKSFPLYNEAMNNIVITPKIQSLCE